MSTVISNEYFTENYLKQIVCYGYKVFERYSSIDRIQPSNIVWHDDDQYFPEARVSTFTPNVSFSN